AVLGALRLFVLLLVNSSFAGHHRERFMPTCSSARPPLTCHQLQIRCVVSVAVLYGSAIRSTSSAKGSTPLFSLLPYAYHDCSSCLMVGQKVRRQPSARMTTSDRGMAVSPPMQLR